MPIQRRSPKKGKKTTIKPQEVENTTGNSIRPEVVKTQSQLNINNHEKVLVVPSSEDDSVDSNATTISAPGKGPESGPETDFESDGSTVDLNSSKKDTKAYGEEINNFQSISNILAKPKTSIIPTNDSPTIHIINKFNCRSDVVVLNHPSRSILPNTLIKNTQNETTAHDSKSEYQNNTNLCMPLLHGTSVVTPKRDISIIRKQPSIMLNSQVSITPCTKSSKANSELHSVDKRKGLYSVKESSIYTIDLTGSPKKRRGMPSILQVRSEETRHKQATRIKRVHFQTPVSSKGSDNKRTSPNMVIPIVDIRDPTAASKLAALGIRSGIPLSELYSTSGNGMHMLPLINLDTAGKPVACNIDAIGASSFLPIGKVINLTQHDKN